MTKVHLLDDLTANQIAAGEVIERPASVVKELVENALDAGTNKIIVEIVKGGLELIKVTDDGYGMSEEDVTLAIKRHATSKIKEITDLDHLRSLGFRGEALASITSVARVEILTRENKSDHGSKLTVTGDKNLTLEPVGIPVGTTVIVSDLFFNTPARKKFLRSARYESGLIHELMIQFSLSHPHIDFRLLHDRKEILNTTGIRSHPHLLEYYYGNSVKEALVEIEGELTDGTVNGYITLPTYHKANRKGMSFFINQRRISSKELLKAVEEAYASLLPKGMFPLCILNLTLDPTTIDVNVHPSKLEVRLRNPLIITELTSILQKELIKQQKIPHYLLAADLMEPVHVEQTLLEPEPLQSDHLQSDLLESQNFSLEPEVLPTINVQTEFKGVQETFREFNRWEAVSSPSITEINSVDHSTNLKSCQVIGQLTQTFILAEGVDGLYIIDQHIAHERVIFENLLEKAEKGTIESQVLLHPVTLHLSLLEEEVVIKHILPLADLGILLEHFGPRTYLLRALPTGIQEDAQDFFYSLLDHLESHKGATDVLDLKKEFLIHSSCKMAIKANTKLTLQEMKQLLLDLSQTNNYLTCPHGRPILYKITNREILKAFHRI